MYRHLSIVKRLTIPYVPLVSGSLEQKGIEPLSYLFPRKVLQTIDTIFAPIAGKGLEPSASAYETDMLPLHHPAIIIA